MQQAAWRESGGHTFLSEARPLHQSNTHGPLTLLVEPPVVRQQHAVHLWSCRGGRPAAGAAVGAAHAEHRAPLPSTAQGEWLPVCSGRDRRAPGFLLDQHSVGAAGAGRRARLWRLGSTWEA